MGREHEITELILSTEDRDSLKDKREDLNNQICNIDNQLQLSSLLYNLFCQVLNGNEINAQRKNHRVINNTFEDRYVVIYDEADLVSQQLLELKNKKLAECALIEKVLKEYGIEYSFSEKKITKEESLYGCYKPKFVDLPDATQKYNYYYISQEITIPLVRLKKILSDIANKENDKKKQKYK